MDKALLALKGIRPVLLAVGALSLIQAAAVIAQALWLAEAAALLFWGGSAGEALRPLGLFAAAFAARHTAVWLQRLCAGRFAERSGESLRLRFIERLFERGPDFAARTGSGRLVTLALDGVDRFRTYLELTVIRTMDMALVTCLILAAVYALDFVSGLILTFTMPVLIVFFILLGFAARRMADKQWRTFQTLAHHFIDVLRGLATLKFLGLSRSYADVVGKVSDRNRAAAMRTLRVAFLSSFALDFFSTLSVAFVAVSLGLRLIDGRIGLEPALAVLLLAPEYFLPVRLLGADYHASLDGKEALQAIRAVTEKERETDEKRRKEPAQPSAALSGGHFRVELVNVGADGENGAARLSNMTASLEGDARKIGIVGMSGAGKTTLLHLLGGFLSPAEGEILIGGRRLSGKARVEWQRQLMFIPQHPYLFSATIADNVRFYEPDASDEEVLRALNDVGLGELIAALPNGIHERIGEGGRMLSGGQAQRVALARALVGRRFVLLLDEPTAHLDLETELELKETMLRVFDGRLVFLATHRLHWMQEMDWIWVLDGGRLAEAGTHEELLARNGPYRKLTEAALGKGGYR